MFDNEKNIHDIHQEYHKNRIEATIEKLKKGGEILVCG